MRLILMLGVRIRHLGDLRATIPRRRQSHAMSAVATALRSARGEVAPEHALLDFVHQRSDRGRRGGEQERGHVAVLAY